MLNIRNRLRTANIHRRSIVLAPLFILAALAIFARYRTPSLIDIRRIALGSDRVALARDGRAVQTLRTDFNKRRLAWLPLNDFPEDLRRVVIESEDRRFYSHVGLDFIGLSRALWANLRGRSVQGASTITMQVTDLIQDDVLRKNSRIQKGSIPHKLVQISRALFMESKWTKNEILEAYLNLIHLRGEFQGVPAVSQAYLHKEPLALGFADEVAIVAQISSPNQGAKILNARACQLAQKLARPEVCDQLPPIVSAFFQPGVMLPTSTGFAPHLARRIFQARPEEAIIRSTLDYDLQKDVTAILEKNISRLRNSNVNDSAAIVIDNRSGEVLAYVGTVSTSKAPFVDGIQAYRQAGSSLKPFFYAKAIEMKRLTAASILLDEPTAISWDGDVYRPTNYDKHFYGPVSVREALASSLNVPAVKTLTVIGLHQAYQVLKSLRLSRLKEPDFYGVSMALGAVEVRLDELANGYRSFANGGLLRPLRFVPGDVSDKTESVYSPEASYIVSSILSDPNARSIGFGWESPLETPFFSAVKTGTSKDYRDNWCVGFSSRYTVAVWAGNFDASAMREVSGVSGVGPSWYDIMLRLHEKERSTAPPAPSGIVEKDVRHSWASHQYREVFIKGTEPANALIATSFDKQAQFVFPAEGSVLVKDPHLDQDRVALFVRFKGTIPPRSRLLMDGEDLGAAVSPFKLSKLTSGQHLLSLREPRLSTVEASRTPALPAFANVRFFVKGAR